MRPEVASLDGDIRYRRTTVKDRKKGIGKGLLGDIRSIRENPDDEPSIGRGFDLGHDVRLRFALHAASRAAIATAAAAVARMITRSYPPHAHTNAETDGPIA